VDLAPEAKLSALREELFRINPRAPLLESIHKPDFLLEIKTERRLPLDILAGRPVAALSGLGSPEQFESSLERNGMAVAQRWRYPDHHRYTRAELDSISHLLGSLPLVTTGKDIVRFPPDWRESLPQDVYVLSVRLELVAGEQAWIDALTGLMESA
jgi:tetraacyldisaccharide 4'-kinase